MDRNFVVTYMNYRKTHPTQISDMDLKFLKLYIIHRTGEDVNEQDIMASIHRRMRTSFSNPLQPLQHAVEWAATEFGVNTLKDKQGNILSYV